ncbi:MAG: 2Fe-2S iron-sulfur cluster-binding protein, partial [Elusimicrobiota bacterium]|nr:2Fe-2S iron-sulfur cluster-binding protein [Elusimicrobiota bacterium]
MSCKIKFLPSGKEITVAEGTDLLSAAMMAGIQIYNSCGGEGVCGRCKVKIVKGEIFTDEQEKNDEYVLACRTVCKADMEVFVPEESRVEMAKILTKGKEIYT